MSFLDIVFYVILVSSFVSGFSKGFLSSALSVVFLFANIYITFYHTADLIGLYSKVPGMATSPYIMMFVTYFLTATVLGLLKTSLISFFGRSFVLNNPLMRLLGGLLNMMLTVVAFSVIVIYLHSKGFYIGNYFGGYEGSTLESAVNYVNGAFDLVDAIDRIVYEARMAADGILDSQVPPGVGD